MSRAMICTNTRASRRQSAGGLRQRRRPAQGLSVVELMIGVTIGLFILAGASLVLTTQLGDNRRLLLEAQVQQDLRATADMMSRDLRADGYWAHAYTQVWPALNDPFPLNPYDTMTPRTSDTGSATVTFSRSLDEEVGSKLTGTDDDVVTDFERGGFRWNKNNGTIDVQLGNGNWQALTDPAVVRVTDFSLVIAANDRQLACGATQQLGPNGCPMMISNRDLLLTIAVEAVHDSNVKRSIQNRIRLRNDIPREVCTLPLATCPP